MGNVVRSEICLGIQGLKNDNLIFYAKRAFLCILRYDNLVIRIMPREFGVLMKRVLPKGYTFVFFDVKHFIFVNKGRESGGSRLPFWVGVVKQSFQNLGHLYWKMGPL